VPTASPAKIRTLIVDDEPLARSSIATLLREDPQIEILGECGSGTEALAEIRLARPDLLFLDVQMPECDGFDVLEMVGNDVPPAVIFVTAYDQYALRAFDTGALDYLLKPFDNARFELALTRAKQRVRDASRGEKTRPRPERIVIKSSGEVCFLKTRDIDWIEAADYYACLHVGPRSHLLRRSLQDLEAELDPEVFCRVHRSSIVNLERVRSLKLREDGEYEVVLDTSARIRMSRRYRKDFESHMGVHGKKL
jgi:two-component system LytT family response regulator